MRVQRKRRSRCWMACLVLATATLATSGCASLYHLTHYNAITETINEYHRPYYHSGRTGRIIPKEHHQFNTVEPPCFGYEPTCWQNWPTDCPNCPPPDRVLSEEVLDDHQESIVTPGAGPQTAPEQVPETVPDPSPVDEVDRILDEPLPDAGDEDPIIPRGSDSGTIDPVESLDVVRVQVEAQLAPEPVMPPVAPEPTTRLPAIDHAKQDSVASLIPDQSILNTAEPSAVEIWESQVAHQQVGRRLELAADAAGRSSDHEQPKQGISFAGPTQEAMRVEKDRAIVLTSSTPAPALRPAEVSSRRTIRFAAQNSPQANGEEISPPNVSPVASTEDISESRVNEPMLPETIGAAPNDVAIPSFKIMPATSKSSNRGLPVVSRAEPVGAPHRMIRFVSGEAKVEARADTAERPADSSLKFR